MNNQLPNSSRSQQQPNNYQNSNGYQNSNNYQNNDGQNNEFDDIDFMKLLKVIFRHKWQIIILTLVVGLFASIYASSLTPIYTARATLLLEADNAKVNTLDDVYNENSGQQEYFYTQLEIIQSTAIAKKVVENLTLNQAPLFKVDKQQLLMNNPKYLNLSEAELTAQINTMQYNHAVGYVRGGLGASPITKTQLVTISFTSPQPEMTALIANAIATAYIDNHMDVSLERIKKSAKWLNASLSGLKTKLEQAEDNLQAFQERESLVDIGGIKSLAANELEELSTQLIKAKQTQKQTELIYTIVAEQKNVEALSALPDVLNHPAVKTANIQKRQAEGRLAELALTYGNKHPKIIAAKADVAREQQNVIKNINRLEITIGNDNNKAKQNIAQLELALAQAKQRYQQLTRTENKRRNLTQEVETNKNLYNAFFTRLKETAELVGFEASVGRLIEHATVPYGPSKPNKKLIITIAMMAAAAFAIGVVLLIEMLNSTIRSVNDVEDKLHQQLLGIVPLVNEKFSNKSKNKSKNKKTIKDHHNLIQNEYFYGEDRSFAEAVRTLRTSLLLLNLTDQDKVFSITSTVPSEGKTVVSTNLAYALGQLGKTILIDTDMRRPSVAKNFNLEPNKPGLSNLIAGSNSLEECIHHDQHSGIDIISAGVLPRNPQELLASIQFKQLINTLKDKYQRIIIDTAPVQAVADAMIVARLADSVIYVVKAESTKAALIKSGIKRMHQAGIKIDGVVLNQVDLSKAKEYEDFNGYYDQYGYNA